MGGVCVLGIGGTSMPGLQERHGPHSTKAELAEASVCARTYSVTHRDRNDCHSKHHAAFLLIGNTISGRLSTEATEPSCLHHPLAANRECFASPPGGAIETTTPQVRPVTWPPAPAGEGCGAAGTQAPPGPAGAFSSSSGNICM